MTHGPNKIHGKCPSCSHVFLVAQLPMPISVAAEAMRAACCPTCGTKKGITIARAEEVPHG